MGTAGCGHSGLWELAPQRCKVQASVIAHEHPPTPWTCPVCSQPAAKAKACRKAVSPDGDALGIVHQAHGCLVHGGDGQVGALDLPHLVTHTQGGGQVVEAKLSTKKLANTTSCMRTHHDGIKQHTPGGGSNQGHTSGQSGHTKTLTSSPLAPSKLGGKVQQHLP